MLSEEQIARLLSARDESQGLTAPERDRIRRVLEQRTADSLDDRASVPVVPADVTSHGPMDPLRERTTSPHTRTRTAFVVSAAACVLALIAVFVTFNRSDDGPEVATGPADTSAASPAQPAPTPTADPRVEGAAAGAAFCAGPLAELTSALADWNGVANWSHLTDARNPEPHLPDRVRAVLGGLTEVVPDISTAARIEAVDSIQAAEGGFTPALRSQAEDVLSEALVFVRETIEADLAAGFVRFADCDPEGLEAPGS